MTARAAAACAVLGTLALQAGSARAGETPDGAPVAGPAELAVVDTAHRAMAAPAGDGRPVGLVRPRRPLTRARTVLPVVGHAADEDGAPWIRVRMPGRALRGADPPATAWIRQRGTRPRRTPWRLAVQTRPRRVVVFRSGKRVRTFGSIVGAPSTPTPRGEYFVEESVRLPSWYPGAPFALATSARSPVLQEFAGGPGQIALHGIENIGGRLGTAASHGCVRLGSRAIRWLASRLGPGTPLTIE